MDGETVVAGKPPKLPFSRAKRHSLQSTEAIARFNKLRKHNSQPKLRKGPFGGSLATLNLESSRRSSSFAPLGVRPLTGDEKSLSASNLAAVSDPNLSVKEAIPKRSYEQPSYSFYTVKKQFEHLVKRYYHQIMEGCGRVDCDNAFCLSNPKGKRFTRDVAAIVSIELATRSKCFFCTENQTTEPLPLPQNLFDSDDDKPKPFLQSLYSSTPFLSLFEAEEEPLDPGRRDSSCYNSRKNLTLGKGGCAKNEECQQTTLPLSSERPPVLKVEYATGKTQEKVEEVGRRRSSSNSSLPDLNLQQKTSPLSFDQEFSKFNLSGNLLTDSELAVSLPSDLRSSNSSLNELLTLEEFEKECALEMSTALQVQEFSLTHLDVPMLESSIKNYMQCQDPSFLVNTLRTVFTSPEALNSSFLKEAGDGKGTEVLDVAAVRQAFEMLLKLQPQETFVSPLLDATEVLLAALDSMLVVPHEVNQLVILMENPLVQTSQGLLRKLCQVLHQTPVETRKAIVTVLAQYDKAFFSSLHQIFQNHLRSLVQPKQTTELHLVEVCSVLQLFFYAHNKSAHRRSEWKQPLSDLYNDDLSQKMDFKKEYENWRSLPGANGSGSQQISLLDFPFLLDPMSKVRVLHLDAVWQMRAEYQNAIVHQARVQQAQRVFEDPEKATKLEDSVKSAMCPFLVLEIRRDHLIEDTLHQINKKEADLKKPLKIKYVGGGEQGLDMGGLQKEFFHMIVDAVFNPNNGMFTYMEESRHIWINGASLESEEEFGLVGSLLGLAIYNGVILDIRFPAVVYRKLQGEQPGLADLRSLQPSLARSLQDLLDYEGDVAETFCYTFQVSSASYGGIRSVELVPNGAEVPVTKENRAQFVELYVRYLLVDSVANQFDPFYQGFHKVCGGAALTLFRPDELELLVCGSPVVDFHELQLAATYEDGLYADHPTVRFFWQTMREMSLEQKKALLMFVTGSDRVPLKGLANITFIIQSHGPDSNRLPSALTCFNRLLLPEYRTKAKLRERLVVAIENCKGFGLT